MAMIERTSSFQYYLQNILLYVLIGRSIYTLYLSSLNTSGYDRKLSLFYFTTKAIFIRLAVIFISDMVNVCKLWVVTHFTYKINNYNLSECNSDFHNNHA